MKVKVGDKIYDGKEQPVMVILTDKDKENISNMLKDCTKYCVWPGTPGGLDAVMEWMDAD